MSQGPAEKIRDLRLRRSLTGSTAIPRLRCKTNPKQIQAEQEVDFEEEVAKFKKDIHKDIQNLKKARVPRTTGDQGHIRPRSQT